MNSPDLVVTLASQKRQQPYLNLIEEEAQHVNMHNYRNLFVSQKES